MAVALALDGARPTGVVFTSCMMMTACAECAEFARRAVGARVPDRLVGCQLIGTPSWWAPTMNTARRAGESPWLRHAWRVPFWTTVSPGRR